MDQPTVHGITIDRWSLYRVGPYTEVGYGPAYHARDHYRQVVFTSAWSDGLHCAWQVLKRREFTFIKRDKLRSAMQSAAYCRNNRCSALYSSSKRPLNVLGVTAACQFFSESSIYSKLLYKCDTLKNNYLIETFPLWACRH